MKVKSPAKSAGGFKAVLSSLIHVFQRLGFWRGVKILWRLNQKKGVDCPGCAWPDPNDCSVVEFCENGVKAIAEEAMPRLVDTAFFNKHSIEELKAKSDYWLGEAGRIERPFYRAEGDTHYRPIEWDEAFEKIARQLKSHEPKKGVFYTSGRTSNEAAFLYQWLVRRYGTNNLPDCSNMCHESSGVGLTETIGVGKGTVHLEDFNKAEVIVVIGQNPGTNHPRMLAALQEAVRKGAQILSINPMLEPGTQAFAHPQEVLGFLGRTTQLTTLHLPVKINGDVALFKGLAKSILTEHVGGLDAEFIYSHTSGFEQYRSDILSTEWSEICEGSGIEQASIQQAAEILAQSKATIFCWAMGITQHRNAVDNVQQIVNLALLGGHIGRPGAGLCPVRGHSNVQGDRTMGIYEKPSASFLAGIEKGLGFTPPTEHGYDTVDAIEAMNQGQVSTFVAMGGNFLSAAPDFDLTAKALEKCQMVVQISTKLNRSHLIGGKEALILPCLARTDRDLNSQGQEQFVSVENSMSVVHSSRGDLKPLSSEWRSEVHIVAQLAKSLLNEDWSELSEDYSKIRDKIEASIAGFENYNQRVDETFVLPNRPRDHRQFDVEGGRARFSIHAIPESPALGDQEFIMMTIRSHDQYNTTVYGLDDRYRGIYQSRDVVFVNEADYDRLQLSMDRPVELTSEYDGVRRTYSKIYPIRYSMPKGCVATYFPEANVLVPLSEKSKKSGTPASKSIRVQLEVMA